MTLAVLCTEILSHLNEARGEKAMEFYVIIFLLPFCSMFVTLPPLSLCNGVLWF